VPVTEPPPEPSAEAVAMLAGSRVTVAPEVSETIARLVAMLRTLLPGVFGAAPVPVEMPPREIPRAREGRPGRIRGIDVSHWNGVVDHAAAARGGIAFVIAKATQGTYLTDPRFADNVAAAREAGVIVGAYHFYDYRQSGRAQARHLLEVLGEGGMLDDALPPVVDIECFAPFGTADQAFVRRELRAFSDTVFAATGRLPMIYTSGHMWEEVTGDDPTFGDHPLWVACWRCPEPYLPPGWDDWLVWQIGSMAVQGRSSRLDGNIARDAAALRRASVTGAGVRGRTITRSRSVAIARPEPGTRTRVRVAGGGWSAWSGPGAVVRTSLPGRDGRHAVEVQRRSASGVLGPIATQVVELDRRGPRIGVTPDRTTGTVEVRADDRGGVLEVEVLGSCRVDRTGRTHTDAPVSARSSLSISVPTGSACLLRVRATDRAGNTTRTVSGPWRLGAVVRQGHRAS
jgi:GH25 family lysozyme M1 (1,4-beta-N-acetylmuramidase)